MNTVSGTGAAATGGLVNTVAKAIGSIAMHSFTL